MNQIIDLLNENYKISFDELKSIAFDVDQIVFTTQDEYINYFLQSMEIPQSKHQILHVFTEDFQVYFYVQTKISIRKATIDKIPEILFQNWVSKENNYFGFINLFLQSNVISKSQIIEQIQQYESLSGLNVLLESLQHDKQNQNIKSSYSKLFGQECGVISSQQSLKNSMLKQFRKIDVIELFMKDGTKQYVSLQQLEQNDELMDKVVRLLV